VDRNVIGERAVDRRGREEDHIGTKVVAATAALSAAPAGNAWLERDTVADGVSRRPCAETDHTPSGFVAEDKRRADDRRSDAPVLVVVRVGAADTYGAHFNEHLAGAGRRHRPLLQDDRAGPSQDRGAIGCHALASAISVIECRRGDGHQARTSS
jgi:hypothetical protein